MTEAYRLVHPRRESCVRTVELVSSEGRQGDEASVGQCYQARVTRNQMACWPVLSGGSDRGDKTGGPMRDCCGYLNCVRLRSCRCFCCSSGRTHCVGEDEVK